MFYGIVFAMAKAFAAAEHYVIISGRRLEVIDQAVQQLQSLYPETQIHGVCCDVSQIADLQNLWDAAIEHFGRVDIWINNAGSCTAILDCKDLQAEEIRITIETNIQGAILGSQVALQGMLKQGDGQIFNMEGWGSRDIGSGDGYDRSISPLMEEWRCESLAKKETTIPIYY